MPYENLFRPLTVGAVSLANRIVMAPLTRNRAGEGDVPRELNALYYQQRASAGLIVSEATQVSRQGQGYAFAPGIYTDAQEQGWARVTSAVHQAGGKMSLQLWHVGRVSNRLLQEGREAPVAPSALRAANAKTFVRYDDGSTGLEPSDTPRALDISEMPGIVAQYAQAAERAKRAGFDMVEVHAANGYLLQQFLATNTNQRSDRYGGSIENRARLVLEVLEAVIGVMGPDRVGMRMSPNFVGFDIADTESEASTLYVARELTRLDVAYLHIAEPDWAGGQPLSDEFRAALRKDYDGCLIVCGNYTAQSGDAMVASGLADAVAFGRAYIANPDLVERFRRQAPLNALDDKTLYGGDEKGYTDYPALSD